MFKLPYIARSTSYAWSSGAPISPDLSFLNSGPAMQSPEIQKLRLRFNGVATTGAGGSFPDRTQVQVFQQVQLTDPKGIRINALGSSLRQLMQREEGNGSRDGATIAASQTTVAFDVELTISFSPARSRTPQDWRMAVSDLVNGAGKLDLNMASTNQISANVTIVSGTVQVWAEIVDGGEPTSKMRQSIIEVGMTTTDFPYAVRGLLVDAWFRAQDSDIYAATTLAAQNITSAQMMFSAYPSAVLNDIYQKQFYSVATNDDVVAGYAHNVFAMPRHAKATQLVELDVLQIQISGTLPTNGRAVIVAITKRNEQQDARRLGYKDFATAAKVLDSARVRAAPGSPPPIAGVGSTAASLPIAPITGGSQKKSG